MVKKYLVDLAVGFAVGLVFFFSPFLLTGEGGLFGWVLLARFIPKEVLQSLVGIFIILMYYLVLNIIPFGVYIFFIKFFKRLYRNLFFSFLFFSMGGVLAGGIFLVLVAIAVSQWRPTL